MEPGLVSVGDEAVFSKPLSWAPALVLAVATVEVRFEKTGRDDVAGPSLASAKFFEPGVAVAEVVFPILHIAV
jgi:hypothetical protein